MASQLIRFGFINHRGTILRIFDTPDHRWQCLIPGDLAFDQGTWQIDGSDLFLYGRREGA